MTKYRAVFYGPNKPDVNVFLKTIRLLNPGLETKNWIVPKDWGTQPVMYQNSFSFVFGLDPKTIEFLKDEKRKFELFYSGSPVKFYEVVNRGGRSEAGPHNYYE